ncbi:hypothetical protein O3P69_012054 [Scylla paramamosain]|uniref:Uncharacterized protein n=1 Tax=Scylla paramamosain TaxID=85552 RepID=A0AAW0SHJ7_SCYPA
MVEIVTFRAFRDFAGRLTTVAPLLSTRGQEAPEMTHLMHRARSLTSVMMVEDPAARTVTSWAATLTSTHTLAPLYPQPGDHHQHHLPPARPRPPPPRAPHHARRPLGDAAPLVAVPGGGRNAVCGGGAGGGSPRAGPRCQELLLSWRGPHPPIYEERKDQLRDAALSRRSHTLPVQLLGQLADWSQTPWCNRRLPDPVPPVLPHPDTMARQRHHSTCYMMLADALLTWQRQEAEGRSKSRVVKEVCRFAVNLPEGSRAAQQVSSPGCHKTV